MKNPFKGSFIIRMNKRVVHIDRLSKDTVKNLCVCLNILLDFGNNKRPIGHLCDDEILKRWTIVIKMIFC